MRRRGGCGASGHPINQNLTPTAPMTIIAGRGSCRLCSEHSSGRVRRWCANQKTAQPCVRTCVCARARGACACACELCVRARACASVRACACMRVCACVSRTFTKNATMDLITLTHGIWRSRSVDNLRASGLQEVVEVEVRLVWLRVEQDVLPQPIVLTAVGHRRHGPSALNQQETKASTDPDHWQRALSREPRAVTSGGAHQKQVGRLQFQGVAVVSREHDPVAAHHRTPCGEERSQVQGL
jgi:hypothetical protein